MSAQHDNPFLLTLPELMSAKKKIGRAACFYDREKMSLQGFDSHSLTPSEFRSQLRANFLIELTNAELGAIIVYFDKDGDGTVDTVEFINEFFKLGKSERQKFAMHRKDDEAVMLKHIEQQAKIKAEKVARLKKTVVANEYSEEDEKSAIEKITRVASTYDNSKPYLKEFSSCGSLKGSEFRELMKRNFQIMLSAREVAAVLHLFDESQTSSDGTIDTRLFVYHFFRMGRAERDRQYHKHLDITYAKQQKFQQRQDSIKERFGQMVIAKMVPATERDRQTAERKIRMAAAYFTRDKAFPVVIEKCFESLDLTPTGFKSILKNNFYIDLSPGELDAVMTMFDTDGDGVISCVEFLTTFFMMGSREKSHILNMHRREAERRKKAEEDRKRRKMEQVEALNRTKVIWPNLPPNDGDEFADSAAGTPAMSRQPSLPSIGPEEQAPSSRKLLRKPSVSDLVAPSAMAVKLMNNSKSLTVLYPKASEDTKSFILEIEEQERQIRETSSVKPKRRKSKSKSRSGQSSPMLKASPGMNRQASSKFAPNMSVHAEDEDSSHHMDIGLDPNNWGTAALPDDFVNESRCDSRGGSRSGKTRVPVVNADSDNAYDDSEFEDNTGGNSKYL
jgi:Ca2+-binding EF-hand superfamily protein